jgi:hypothetical protein
MSETLDTVLEEIEMDYPPPPTCFQLGQELGSFPCDASNIEAASLGLAAGGVSLLFTLWLFHKVRKETKG